MNTKNEEKQIAKIEDSIEETAKKYAVNSNTPKLFFEKCIQLNEASDDWIGAPCLNLCTFGATDVPKTLLRAALRPFFLCKPAHFPILKS